VLSTAAMDRFSSDRTIRDYATEIWRVSVAG
jgi:glucan phosphorylase